MEVNKEEAERSLTIAKQAHSAGDIAKALRFTKKSIVLFETKNALSFLETLEKAEKSTGTSTPASSTRQRTNATASTSSAKPATPAPADAKPPARDFTPVQVALVKKIRAYKVHEYYKILDLNKSCEDAEVKKGYKKLALALHPDKNGAPGADEAFKMVSKAFQVLSDSNKRAIFDQTGSDPDSRGGGGGGGGGGNGMASAFARGRPQGGGFGGAQEMSPEDLFNMFFGGQAGFGGSGVQFGGGGNQFRTQFYGPGGARMSGGQQQQPRAQNGAAPNGSVWLQVAPLIALLVFSFLTQIPSLFSSKTANPEFSFSTSPQFTVPRTTTGMGIDYFVNAQQFSRHPLYEEELKRNPSLNFLPKSDPGTSAYRQELFENILKPKQLDTNAGVARLAITGTMRNFEKLVEAHWTGTLQRRCQTELDNRQARLENARGFLGFGADFAKIREITAERPANCMALKRLGYSVQF